mmetsp:Transcript_11947/g.22133  ORF Transcript_11947/g.22133 Transcript_11947/m.22133 type:complete len:190 (-) Transcript_11947:279-848(-)
MKEGARKRDIAVAVLLSKKREDIMWRGNESDQSEQDPRKEILVANWKEQSRRLKSNGNVYVLLLSSWNHASPRGEDPEIIGVFDSKAAAVARASTVGTDYGTFDEAIKEMFLSEYEHEDNRENPPDNGVLMQIGGDDVGEGDFCRLSIKKMPILGIQNSGSKDGGEKKRKRSESAGKATDNSTIDLCSD